MASWCFEGPTAPSIEAHNLRTSCNIKNECMEPISLTVLSLYHSEGKALARCVAPELQAGAPQARAGGGGACGATSGAQGALDFIFSLYLLLLSLARAAEVYLCSAFGFGPWGLEGFRNK